MVFNKIFGSILAILFGLIPIALAVVLSMFTWLEELLRGRILSALKYLVLLPILSFLVLCFGLCIAIISGWIDGFLVRIITQHKVWWTVMRMWIFEHSRLFRIGAVALGIPTVGSSYFICKEIYCIFAFMFDISEYYSPHDIP